MQESLFNISNNLCYYIVDSNLETNIDTNILSKSELRKFNRFRKKEDALTFYYGRKILYRYQQENNPINLQQIQIGEYGKPFISGKPFFFNISHSNPYVAVAFSKGNEVGIDIEQIPKRSKIELLKMAKIVFSENEIAELQQLSDKASKKYFTRLWVLKESYIKLKGKGFYIDTKEIIFQNIESLKPKLISPLENEINFELRVWQNEFYICTAYVKYRNI